MKHITLFKIFLVVLFISKNLYSIDEFVGYSARIKAMGDVACGIADSVESVSFNPAGLHTVSFPQISLGYQALWMLLTENESLGSGYISMFYPFKKLGSLGLTYSNFNVSSLYQQHIALFTYSNKLFNSFFLGINAKYLSVVYTLTDEIINNSYFANFGNQMNNFTVDAGILYKKEKFSFGLSAQNLNKPRMTLNPQEEDYLKSRINIGIGIYPTKTFIVGFEANYDTTLKACLGIEKNFPKESISIRAGGNYLLNGGIAEVSLGFGYRIPVNFGGIVLNYTFSYPLTQISNIAGHHFVSFLIDFNKETQQEVFYRETQKTIKYEDKQQLKEEIEKSLKAQLIKLELSKEVLKKDDQELKFKVEISTEVVGWQLVITDSKQKVIKKFYSNLMTQEIIWDLKTEEGRYITPGKYNCFVIGVDKKENKIESQVKTFILSEKLQQETIQQETIICPNCGAENIKGERFCVRCRELLPR